ncbi:aldo/keto reductase [Rathayibacter soli]|uniref:aldo/keto reductase n=1 Tax=Rathayibacter soli TaxID=3144168 RepID=UPI0027E3F385|nr:aldo/keto reductase [Glaciibacter superstes]
MRNDKDAETGEAETGTARHHGEPPVALRPLGRTGLDASPITLGASKLGRGTQPGSPEEVQAIALAAAMLHGPYALIDTSNGYADGRSETVLGAALKRAGAAQGRRIATKADRDPETGAFDRDRVLRSFDESTRRLGLEHIEVLHLHDPYTISFDEAMAAGGAVAGLIELRDEGRVDAIGVAFGPISTLNRYVATGAFDLVLTHNRFTLANRSAEPVLRTARDRGMGVFNAAPFGGGLLARGAASGATYHYTQSPPALLDWVARAEQVCLRHGIDLPTAALHFSLRSPLIDTTVVGTSSPARIANLELMRLTPVPGELWSELDALGTPPTPILD